MRALVVCCLVAACGNQPGLMLVVKGKTADVASVEVFLPDNVEDGSSIGMPPAKSTPVDGSVYSVIDSVKTTVSGDARILLQPGDTHDVPGLLVVAYDGTGKPVAETVVRNSDGSWLHLPSTNTVEIQITLEPAMYVPPMMVAQTTGTRITRWSPNGAAGDLNGGCIAVLAADGNSFFDRKDDPDCDGKTPECNDHVWDFVDTSATPPLPSVCVSHDFKMPDTGRACRVGQTVACTDGIGTCGPLTNGTTALPICVPEALCKACPNSDSTDPNAMSGLDMTCEQDALMNGEDLPYVDCDLDAIIDQTSGIQPCMDNLPPFDFSMYAGTGWSCAHGGGFIDSVGKLGPLPGALGPLLFGLDNGGATGYSLTASCPSETAPAVQFSMTALNNQITPIPSNTTAKAVLVFGTKSPTAVGAFAELAVPFHLHFHPVQQCSTTTVTESCQLKTLNSGDGANDAMWSGCAGAM